MERIKFKEVRGMDCLETDRGWAVEVRTDNKVYYDCDTKCDKTLMFETKGTCESYITYMMEMFVAISDKE